MGMNMKLFIPDLRLSRNNHWTDKGLVLLLMNVTFHIKEDSCNILSFKSFIILFLTILGYIMAISLNYFIFSKPVWQLMFTTPNAVDTVYLFYKKHVKYLHSVVFAYKHLNCTVTLSGTQYNFLWDTAQNTWWVYFSSCK